MQFFQADDIVIPVSSVVEVNTSQLATEGIIFVGVVGGYTHRLEGQPALDAMMRIFPAAVEGKRLRFRRHAWAFHNLLAHPILQVCAWAGMPRLGMKIHDWTVPNPKGVPDAE